MNDRSTVRSRTLGVELVRLRKGAGLTVEAVAGRLGCSASRVSRLESGKRGVPDADLAAYLAFCDVTGPLRRRLLELHQNSRLTTWVQPHGELLPDELTSVLHAESAAVSIAVFDPQGLPALLQTGDFARAVFHRNPMPGGDVDRFLRARSRRQCVHDQLQPPSFTFFITESVLRQPVCTPQVMHDQVLRLIRFAGQVRCTIRIVRHGGFGNGFELITGRDHDPVALVETPTAHLFVEDRAQTSVYRAILTQLGQAALGETESRRQLADLIDPRWLDSPTPLPGLPLERAEL
jgi:transcriptional regulator with XRE-family HTH domain